MTPISISDVTTNVSVANNVVSGDGIFDDLMETITVHLKAQYDANRITGAQYADVYLGAIQTAIIQSMQFALGKDKATKEAELLSVQASKARIEIYLDKIIKEQAILDAKIKNGDEVIYSVWELTYEGDPDTYTYTTLDNLTENDVKSRVLMFPHVEDTAITGVTLSSSTVLHQAGTSLAEATIQKTEAEVDVLNQKGITEFAQTLVTEKTTPHADSLAGRQASLYNEQAKGFKWNADQKYLKTLLDAWSVNINTAGVADISLHALIADDDGATGDAGMNSIIKSTKPA